MAKILLVDDDKLMVKMYQGKFEDDGYDVLVAVDGQMGFDKALEVKPDLILLDIMMPRVNGLEMLKNLKSNDTTKNIPVILLTNVGGETDAEQGLSLGAVAYMVKAHYDAKDVVKKVKEILGGYVHDLPKVEVIIEGEKNEKRDNALKEAQNAEEELQKAQQKVKEASKRLEETS
jgi:DNA-binding response OmpR family regulator